MVADRLAAAARHLTRWQFPAARDILRDILDDPQSAASTMQRQTARRMLAEALRELGAVADAYGLAEPLFAECAAAHGERHPATVRAAALLAAILHDLGELDRAEELYHLVLAAPPDPTGPAGRAVALAAANAALLRADRGDLASAHSGLVEAHAHFRQAFGGEDLDTIRIGAELATLHQRMGDLAAARRVLAVAHAAARSALGEEHPLTRAIEADLAAIEPPMPAPAGGGHHRAPEPVIEEPRRRPRPNRRTRILVAAAALAAGAATAGAGIGYPRLAPVFDSTPNKAAAETGGTAPTTTLRTTTPPTTAPPKAAQPTSLKLKDKGSALSVTWVAPPGTTAPTRVVVSRPGRGSVASAELAPGVSVYEIGGLSPDLEYCVTVSLVDGAQAGPICTHRSA